jgi:signal peptidase II
MPGSNHSAYALSKSPVQVRVFARLSRIARYKWLLSLAAVVFMADQLSKAWIVNNLPFNAYFPPDSIVVIPDFFNIVHLGNTGAAWGIFQGMSYWLGLLAVTALAAIFIFRRHLHLDLPVVQFSFGLLCGGILGNLVDRLRHGYVVDFLDFHFGSYTWPAFNIADAGIVVGVGIYILCSFVKPSAIERKE